MTYENKFGMFVHWGLYSMTRQGEQVLAGLNMDNKEYEKLQYAFNPDRYDPEKWVLLAKKAGMKYICFTTKHHDGFCLWDTKYTDYNIMNTPYGKDVLKMLADACAKHGMLLSLYYSNPDWHHKYGYNPASSHQWKAIDMNTVDLDIYRKYVKNQITELLTNYGPIYTLFWDIPPKYEDPSINELARSLQPNIYINDRGWDKGDFSTPEREYTPIDGSCFTRMTEACNSVGEQSWGYREKENFYSKKYLCSSIDRVMAMGGSYLLNVGPDEFGEITDEYEKHLMKVSDWYNRMGGCLECHESDAFNYGFKKSKCIANKKDGKTYLHFYNGLDSSAVTLTYVPSFPKKIRQLNNGTELSFERLPLPECKSCGVWETYYQIRGIETDEYASEPIVIEIEW